MSTKEKLKRDFLGNEYRKFKNNSFSLPAFLFGGLYYMYRKMVIKGLLFNFIFIIIIDFFGNRVGVAVSILTTILFNLMLGFLFNSSYRKYVNRRIEKIESKIIREKEREYKINNDSSEELDDIDKNNISATAEIICKNKKRTSKSLVVFGLTCQIIFSYAIFILEVL